MYPNNIFNIGIQGAEMKRCNIKRRPLADTVLEALKPEEKEYREKDSNNLYGSRLADLHLILPNEVPQLSC